MAYNSGPTKNNIPTIRGGKGMQAYNTDDSSGYGKPSDKSSSKSAGANVYGSRQSSSPSGRPRLPASPAKQSSSPSGRPRLPASAPKDDKPMNIVTMRGGAGATAYNTNRSAGYGGKLPSASSASSASSAAPKPKAKPSTPMAAAPKPKAKPSAPMAIAPKPKERPSAPAIGTRTGSSIFKSGTGGKTKETAYQRMMRISREK